MKNPIQLAREDKFYEWLTGHDLQGNPIKTKFSEVMGLKDEENGVNQIMPSTPWGSMKNVEPNDLPF